MLFPALLLNNTRLTPEILFITIIDGYYSQTTSHNYQRGVHNNF